MTDQAPGSGSSPSEGGGRGPEGPNPFSREGSEGGAHSLDPAADASAPSGPDGTADPYGYHAGPGPTDAPAPDQPPGPPSPGPLGPSGPGQSYGQNTYPSAQPSPDPSQPYPHPGPPPYVPPSANAYGVPGQPPPGTYDPSGYGVAPHAGGYGGSYPDFGAPAMPHPQATPALVTGIIAAFFGVLCGVGGRVGIVSIVLGAKVRREIDSDPARYTGRGPATAGLVLGIVSVVALVVWVVVFAGFGIVGS